MIIQILTILTLLISLNSPPLWAEIKPIKEHRIVIDPGHGGEDCGAKKWIKRKKICEKDIALRLAKLVEKNLKASGFKVLLTRESDISLSLEQRAKIAQSFEADLFVSIHLNSHSNPYSKGFETFYLDNHKDLAIAKLEEVENKSDSKNDIVKDILNDFIISRLAPESKRLANDVHKNISRYLRPYKRADRGTKPALFYVLALTKVPAILLEAGFMSNSSELSLLRSNEYLNKYSKAVSKGLKDYIASIKKAEVKIEEPTEVPLF